jgi:hypothetical protein
MYIRSYMEADEDDMEAIVHKDTLKGIALLKRGAEEGDANCLCSLGDLYSGDSRYSRDIEKLVDKVSLYQLVDKVSLSCIRIAR